MPAGFHIASAWVDIHVEDGGLRREIQSAVRSAVAGADGRIDLEVEAGKLRARVEAAVRAATSGASGDVQLNLDAKDLRGKIEAAVKSASTGARGEVKLDLDAGSLRAKVAAALKAATAGQDGKVKLDVDATGLRARVSAAVRTATSGQDHRIRVDLDADDFNARLGRLLASTRSERLKIQTEVDSTGLRTGLATATRAAAAGAKVKVQLDLDSNSLNAKVRSAIAVASRERIRTGIDVDAAGLRAKVSAAVAAAGARQKIEVKMDVDRNSWAAAQSAVRAFTQGASSGMDGLTSKLRAIPGLGRLAAGGIGIIGPAIALVGMLAMVAFNAIVLLGGALAALVAPAGLIALGGFLQQANLQVTAFTTSLKSIGTEISASMGPAINAAMTQIVGGLSQMRGALTQMFSNAAQLVQPLTTALMGLVSNSIPGVTAALSNLQAAMPGIQSGFAQMGQGIGNFFKELTANGAAVGRVWDTIGQGVNRVLSSLGQAFAKLANNDAAVALLGATFEALAQTIDVAASATAAFAPLLLQLANHFNTLMGVAGPALEFTGKLASSFSQLTQGNLAGAIGSFFSDGKSKADEFKNSMAQIPGVLSTVAGTSAQTASAVRQQADAMAKAAAEAAKLDAAFGPGTSAIKERLDSAKESADALANSLSALATGAQNALGGQIDLGNAIAKAKDSAKDLGGSLTMSNGQLNLTSQKARDAAESLNSVAEAGMKSAMAFAEQGNWAQAAGAIDKTRSAIVSLGQSFGLSKGQATELANQLTTFADKEYTFKLNMEGAKAGLADVKAAFDAVGKEEKVVKVTAMTDSAKAAITALGFQVKDLGNGQFEVKANTDTAKAALTGLQSVLDALSNKQANVNVKADQVPAVTAALQALGMKVESLPDGTIKVTAQDGASTIIEGVKGKIEGIPKSKDSKLTASGNLAEKAQTAQERIAALAGKEVSLNGTGNLDQKAKDSKSAIDAIPTSKSSVLNASGTAKTLAEAVRQQIQNIPNSKDSKLNASGNAKSESDAVKKAIDSLPPEKQIAVLVEVSQNATSALTTLKQTLDGMNNTSIHISINVLGKDGVAQVTADLKNMPASKNVTVSVNVSGKGEVDSVKSAINSLKSKSVTASAKASGTGEVKSLNSAINGLKGKSVNVRASVSGEGQVKGLSSAINAVKSKSVTVTANVNGTAQTKALTAAINTVKSKTVSVRANVSGTGAVQALRSAIASVNSKTVTVTVVTKKVGSAAGGGLMEEKTLQGFSGGGAPARNYKPGGNVIGPGTATSDEILARLSNGEFVIRAAMVRKFGHGFFSALNAGVVPSSAMAPMTRFASGGGVGAASSTVSYTVQKGDTLWALAKKFNTTVDELVRINKIMNRNLIFIGQKLSMPSKGGKSPWGNTPGTGSSGVSMPGYGTLPMAPPPTAGYAWHEVARKNPSFFTKGTSTNPGESIVQARRDLLGMTQVGVYGQLAGTNRGSFYHDLISAQDMQGLIGALYKARGAVGSSDLVASRKNKLLSQLDAGGLALMQNFVQLEKVNIALEDATEKLGELKQQFDQLKGAVKDNVLEYGKITKIGTYGTSVNTLVGQLGRDVAKAEQFSSMLAALKSKGLDPAMISDIAQAGISGGGFATAQSLMNASPEQVAELNALQQTLTAHAEAAGTTVANAMYKAGLDSAQGLVDGLKAQQEQIKHVMRQIAASMELAIKQALGIASPSKVMHKLGAWTGVGYEEGIRSKVGAVMSAIHDMVGMPSQVTRSGVTLPGQAIANGLSNNPSGLNATMGGGNVHIGRLDVHIDGTFDLSNPAERRNVAKLLVAEIKEEIRLSDRARR